MLRRLLRTAVPVPALLLLAATSAGADCVTSDLQGTWRVYQTVITNEGIGWLRCTIRLSLAGVVQSGGSCVDATGDSAPTSGGQLAATAACAVTGTIKITTDLGQVVFTINAGLDRGKSVLTGIGTFPQTLEFATFTATKR